MPCRSYEDDYPDPSIGKLKETNDKLARIACRALSFLEENDSIGMLALILEDEETADWWSGHKEADRKAQEELALKRKKAAEKAALTRKKNEIKARLSPEELKILGVK